MDIFLHIASLACLLAAAIMLVRALPAQNVAFIILFLVAVEVAFEYWNESDDLLDGAMFWPGAIILLRIGMQRLLKPYRPGRNHGLFLIGLTSAPPAVVPLMLDLPKMAAIRFCLTAICLVFLTPWFLQKRITTSGESKE
jgi:hypothetical protein